MRWEGEPGTLRPLQPPAEVPTVDPPGSPLDRSCQAREGRLAQWGFNQDGGRWYRRDARRTRGHSFFCLLEICVACLSAVRSHPSVGNAISLDPPHVQRNAQCPVLDKKKQRRHGELGSSQCLSCKRSNWNPFPLRRWRRRHLGFLTALLLQSHFRGSGIEASARAWNRWMNEQKQHNYLVTERSKRIAVLGCCPCHPWAS